MVISFVQYKTLQGPNPGNPFTVTFDSSTASNNAIILAVATPSVYGGIVSVTDNKSNSYTKVTTSTDSVSGNILEVWYTAGMTGGSSHTLTVTPNTNAATEFVMEEWSGLGNGLVKDKHASASGTTASPSSGSTATTLTPNELVWGATYVEAYNSDFSNSTVTAGSGFSNLHNSALAVYTESKSVSATGAYSATYTITNDGSFSIGPNWAAIVATFTTTQSRTLGIITSPTVGFSQLGLFKRTLAATATPTVSFVKNFSKLLQVVSVGMPSNVKKLYKTLSATSANSPAFSLFTGNHLIMSASATVVTSLGKQLLFKRTLAGVAGSVAGAGRTLGKSLTAVTTFIANLVTSQRVADISTKGRIKKIE